MLLLNHLFKFLIGQVYSAPASVKNCEHHHKMLTFIQIPVYTELTSAS